MTNAATYPDIKPNAIAVLNRRYLKKDHQTSQPTEVPDTMFRRVADNLAEGDRNYGADDAQVAATADQFFRVMRMLEFLPNSPTLMNAGRELQQLAACFVLPVDDSLYDIFTTVRSTTLIHQSGGGTGFAFSRLRPEGDLVRSSGGVASGPASFIKAFDVATDVVVQGGTRRGANMGVLRVDHPDVLKFIKIKADGVTLSNFNISIAVDSAFMAKVASGSDYELINPRTNLPVGSANAAQVFNTIVQQAWATGDPGLLFLDRMNADNPNPQLGEIESTNPCVTADTWTMTTDGPRQVADLIGRPYCSTDSYGAHQSDPRGFYSSGKQDIYRLVTQEGYTVRLTANHPVKKVLSQTADSVIYAFCPARDLVPGDQLKTQQHLASPRWPAPPQRDREAKADFQALHQNRAALSPDQLRNAHMGSYRYHQTLIGLMASSWGAVQQDPPALVIEAADFAPHLQLMLSRIGVTASSDASGSLTVSEPDLRDLREAISTGAPPSLLEKLELLTQRAPQDQAPRHATFQALIPEGSAEVYDVTIPSHPEFDAGGLHLHNCLSAATKLATHLGPSKLGDLYDQQSHIAALTDSRVPKIQAQQHAGGVAVETRTDTATILRRAVPVFKTRSNWPVFRLRTNHGFQVVATDDHKFYTNQGPVQLKDLNVGDEILIQGGPGAWNEYRSLPHCKPTDKFKTHVDPHEAQPPTEWSQELGQLLGWVVTDGWVSHQTPPGRNVPKYDVGLTFGGAELEALAPLFDQRIARWIGVQGSKVEHNTTTSLHYSAALYQFLRSLGINDAEAAEQRVPDTMWNAPRDAVQGFLSAIFTADATVNISSQGESCTIKLASSSESMIQDVQLMLLNFGIVAKTYQRRTARNLQMPAYNHNPATYFHQPKYELLIDGRNRETFLSEIGFMTQTKQDKALNWQANHGPDPRRETYTDNISSIEFEGIEDVYCTTEPQTHSIIANGFVTAQCGEQSLLPYESCNLGSINLSRMTRARADGTVELDIEKLQDIAHTAVHLLDNVIDMNRYPLPEIEEMTKKTRRIGVGVMGFSDLLIQLGIRYDSPEGVAMAEHVMNTVRESVYSASQHLAQERGPFPEWEHSIYSGGTPMRNSAPTTIAPTGTISIIAGASSGIEPLFALAYVRNVMDNTELGEVNDNFVADAKTRGFYSEELMQRIALAGGQIPDDADEIPDDIRHVYRTSHQISPEWHVRMQAAFQTQTDNAVSKTINLPSHATVDDVRTAYELAHELGCKGITVYRDGSKPEQVLNTGANERHEPEHQNQGQHDTPPKSWQRPRRIRGTTERINTYHGAAYVTVNTDDFGNIVEVFAAVGKPGGCDQTVMQVLTRMTSVALQHGVPPDVVIRQLRGSSCCPTYDNEMIVLSPSDAIGIALERILMPDRANQETIIRSAPDNPAIVISTSSQDQRTHIITLPPGTRRCPECNGFAILQEGCLTCHNCGWEKC